MNSYENCTMKLIASAENCRKAEKKLIIKSYIKAGLSGGICGLGALAIKNAGLFNDISKLIPINSGFAIGIGLIILGADFAVSAGYDAGRAWGLAQLEETNNALINVCKVLDKKEEN